MDQTSSSWACEFCSVVNRGSKCSSCGVLKNYESPRRSPSAGRKQHRRQSNNDSSTVILADSRSSEQAVKWTCTLCSYKNWPNATKCVMCNNRRNTASSGSRNSACSSSRERAPEDVRGAVGGPSNIELSSGEEQRKWKCTTCTYENWPRSTKCTLCCASKQVSPPLSPLSSAGSISGLYQEVSGGGQPGDMTELQSRIQSLSVSDKIKQIRNKMNETDWLFLNACMGVVNNDFAAVQSYLQASAGSDRGRQMTKQEASLLNKPSVYTAGTTLVHLALRFQRTDVLCQLLTPANPDARKRLPSQSNTDLATSIRRELVAVLEVHKGDWPCVFVSQVNTFFIPQDVDKFSPGIQRKLFDDIVDKDVEKNLKDNHIINWSEELLSSRLYPLWNRTAGDCLLDSLLQATWGVMDRDNSLRRAMADSLADGASRFFSCWKESEKLLSIAQGYVADESQLSADWSSLISVARKPRKSLEQIHIFVLSHVLRRPIIVYGVRVVLGASGDPLGTVNFNGIYLPLLWEANFCWKSPVALGYTRGHFSALVGSGSYNGSCEQFVYLPLVDNHGYTMPVHFLTEQEMGNQENLLNEYCDCCVTKGGISVAKQSVTQQPASVSRLLDEWLVKYKRMDKKTRLNNSHS